MVECDCEDWRKSAPQIVDAERFYFVRHGVKYAGALMRFCPWCGKALQNYEFAKKQRELGKVDDAT